MFKLRPVAQGAIAFYESVRPVFEATYNRLGVPPAAALNFDQMLWYSCLKHGPSDTALVSVVVRMEKAGYHVAEESLEGLQIQEVDGDVGEMIDLLLRPAWSPEPPALSELMNMAQENWSAPVDRGYKAAAADKPLGPRNRQANVSPSNVWCDNCGAQQPVVSVRRKGFGLLELCGVCVPIHNSESDKWLPYGQREHMRYV